ncbi:phosphate acetyltransferase [Thermincola potens]|uniref:Phosphate acetyltransferase n=1 Tax=Thermincola potens (strain JR) TaxID=635013 RepID=D5X8Q1_THEPJ|nr:phosphate acetyltransferase [Thermincola potens]ADG82927.1 phosphate acetyltransferase [Thermincola potens JR]
MDVLAQIKEKARRFKTRIVLPESSDLRVLKAAGEIERLGIAHVVLLGEKGYFTRIEREHNISLDGIEIVSQTKKFNPYRDLLYNLRKHKGLTYEEAGGLVKNPLYYGALMVKAGDCDGMVAGSLSPTADVLRPALQIIKTAPGISVVSGAFIMIIPNKDFGDDGVMLFADCAVNPDPTAEQLAEIAYTSAVTAKSLLGMEPRVGMLSFSTKGSARHEKVFKVRQATEIARQRYPSLVIDGELQADAALVPSVGRYKAPGSQVAGRVNVLIFPDLQSGNIGYKLGQRLANAEAIGPVLQGMAKPVNDLSRGCSEEDIVNVVAITAVQAQGNKTAVPELLFSLTKK